MQKLRGICFHSQVRALILVDHLDLSIHVLASLNKTLCDWHSKFSCLSFDVTKGYLLVLRHNMACVGTVASFLELFRLIIVV